MYSKVELTIKYKNKTYSFKSGSEVYIFHTGIYSEIDRKYSLKQLLEYTELVHDAYIGDDNRTPLGALADYAADNWKKAKNLSPYELLDKFYEWHF